MLQAGVWVRGGIPADLPGPVPLGPTCRVLGRVLAVPLVSRSGLREMSEARLQVLRSYGELSGNELQRAQVEFSFLAEIGRIH